MEHGSNHKLFTFPSLWQAQCPEIAVCFPRSDVTSNIEHLERQRYPENAKGSSSSRPCVALSWLNRSKPPYLKHARRFAAKCDQHARTPPMYSCPNADPCHYNCRLRRTATTPSKNPEVCRLVQVDLMWLVSWLGSTGLICTFHVVDCHNMLRNCHC